MQLLETKLSYCAAIAVSKLRDYITLNLIHIFWNNLLSKTFHFNFLTAGLCTDASQLPVYTLSNNWHCSSTVSSWYPGYSTGLILWMGMLGGASLRQLLMVGSLEQARNQNQIYHKRLRHECFQAEFILETQSQCLFRLLQIDQSLTEKNTWSWCKVEVCTCQCACVCLRFDYNWNKL